MPSIDIGFRGAPRLIGGLSLALALISGFPAQADPSHTSPADRERFVSVTQRLEAAPLDPGLQDDRAWAVSWLTEAPDVSVSVCANMFGAAMDEGYPEVGAVVVQYTLALGAAAIAHPEAANDTAAQQMTGVEGALNAYRSILRDKPDAHSPSLDGLLEVQGRGELAAYVQAKAASCFSDH